MEISRMLSPIAKMAKYTIVDEVRHKSFVIMFVVCAICVSLIRGCSQGNYMVNGQSLDAGTVARTLSQVSFHVIGAGVMIVAALLSMRIFRRDRNEGTQSCILSKPIARWQYVLGKTLGLWILSVLFMFILHSIVFLITSVDLKVFMPGYLAASLLCSVNLLFVVIAMLLASLLMPDIVAFMSVLGVGVVGFVADGIAAASHSQLAQAVLQQSGSHPESNLAWWKIVYLLWPKLFGVQQLASSLGERQSVHGFGLIYPLLNVMLYCLILGVLLFKRFRNEEII
jgi:ABC-type transport system involved in multi-copper enzyme maturation permease subunit